jgi:hypothetical protein
MSEIAATGSMAYALGWRAFKSNRSHVPPVGFSGSEQTQFLRGYRDAKRIFNEPDRSAHMARAKKTKRKSAPKLSVAAIRKLIRTKAKFETAAKKLRAELRRCRKALATPIPRKRTMPKMRVSDLARILGVKPRTKRKTSTRPYRKHRHNLA